MKTSGMPGVMKRLSSNTVRLPINRFQRKPQAGDRHSCSVGIEENCLKGCMTISERSIAWIICCTSFERIVKEDKTMKKLLSVFVVLALTLSYAIAEESAAMNRTINVIVNGETRTATLSDNASADAFYALLAEGSITIDMHDYGGFEKVGPLGTEIVRSDEDITTTPGDIILYLGSNVTIYYDVNSWDFTLLGHIDGATGENMREFLGDGNPSVTFSLTE